MRLGPVTFRSLWCHFAKLKGTEKGWERDGKGTVKGRGGDLGKLRGEGRGHFFITFWSFLRHFYASTSLRSHVIVERKSIAAASGPCRAARACLRDTEAGWAEEWAPAGPSGSETGAGRRPGVVTSEWLVRGWLWGERAWADGCACTTPAPGCRGGGSTWSAAGRQAGRARDTQLTAQHVSARERDGVGDGGDRAVLRCARLWGW